MTRVSVGVFGAALLLVSTASGAMAQGQGAAAAAPQEPQYIQTTVDPEPSVARSDHYVPWKEGIGPDTTDPNGLSPEAQLLPDNERDIERK